MKMELRFQENELRFQENKDEMVVSGYVNITNQLSEVLGTKKKFKEKISKGAFDKAIRNNTRGIDFLDSHNGSKILASTRNESLTLREDKHGLYMSAVITPTTYGKDTYELIKSGIFKNMSFGFRTIKDSWRALANNLYERTIEELELFEISVVRDPAYSQSTISARGIDLASIDLEEVELRLNKLKGVENMKKIEKRSTNEFAEMLQNEEMRNLQTTESGTALIPENIENMIVLKMEEISPVFARARKFNSVSGSLKIARETGLENAGFVGETFDLNNIALSFSEVKLEQKRVGAAISLTNQLINDSAVDIESYVTNLLARRTIKAVEKSILTGSALEEFKGIIHDEDVAEVELIGAVTIDTFLEMYLKIHPEFLASACFIMNRDFFNQVSKLKDGNNHFYLQNGIVNGKLTYTLLGLPVEVTESLTAEVPVIFGNIEESYGIMIKKGFGLQRIVADSTQALRGSQLFILDGYMDGAVINPQALVKLTIKE